MADLDGDEDGSGDRGCGAGGLDRLLDRVGRDAARHGHAKFGKDFLALVLVNLHEGSLGTEVENRR